MFRLDEKDLKDNSDPDALLSMEEKAIVLVSNAVQHNLPLKNFKADSMYIDTLYSENIFGSYFLLEDWKESLKEEIMMSLKNAYTVLIENSEAELYVIPRDILQQVSQFERVSYNNKHFKSSSIHSHNFLLLILYIYLLISLKCWSM